MDVKTQRAPFCGSFSSRCFPSKSLSRIYTVISPHRGPVERGNQGISSTSFDEFAGVMNCFSNKVLDSDASALPGRPFCWSNLHLPPNILRPTTAGRPRSLPPQATPTLTLRSTPLPLWPAPRSPRRPPACLPNLRPSRRPRACSRCRRGSSLPRSWWPRRPQCCPGRHEPRRASRRWPRPRDSRQRASACIMANNWPSTPPASAPSHVQGNPTPGPIPPQAVQQTMPTSANVVATRSSPGPAAAASSFSQSRLAAAGVAKPCRSPGPSRTHALLKLLLGFARPRRMLGSPAGLLSLLSRHNGRSQPPC